VTGIEERDVGLDHLGGLLAEGERDLIARELHVEPVDVAQHAQREHVLAAPCVGHQLPALALHRHFVHLVALGHESVVGVGVGVGDLRVGVVAPHALQQDQTAGRELAGADAADEHLLVEGDDQVGLIAAVGYAA